MKKRKYNKTAAWYLAHNKPVPNGIPPKIDVQETDCRACSRVKTKKFRYKPGKKVYDVLNSNGTMTGMVIRGRISGMSCPHYKVYVEGRDENWAECHMDTALEQGRIRRAEMNRGSKMDVNAKYPKGMTVFVIDHPGESFEVEDIIPGPINRYNLHDLDPNFAGRQCLMNVMEGDISAFPWPSDKKEVKPMYKIDQHVWHVDDGPGKGPYRITDISVTNGMVEYTMCGLNRNEGPYRNCMEAELTSVAPVSAGEVMDAMAMRELADRVRVLTDEKHKLEEQLRKAEEETLNVLSEGAKVEDRVRRLEALLSCYIDGTLQAREEK